MPSAPPVSSGATPVVPIVSPHPVASSPTPVLGPPIPLGAAAMPTAVDGLDTEPMLGGPVAPPARHHPPLLSTKDGDDDPLPGSAVGEYVLEERIGEGGFGAVYRAQHPMIGKLAAVKVLSSAFSSNAELSKRFVNEARVVNRINHRNIVDIFSFGHLPDGRQYFVMEYLDGQSLGAYLAHRTKLPVEEALPIFRAVASAVDAAHEAGVVHRDLKPDNVFLARDGQGNTLVKLLDFGIAKIDQGPGVSNQTRPGQVLGTPSYMSPEQARGGKVDGRSDVYSFAALVHRTLAGRSLFFGLGAIDVALAHINEPPPRLSTAAPGLPPELDEPLQRALSKKPGDRPATLGAVVEALTEAARAAGLTIPDELPKLTGFAPRKPNVPPAAPAAPAPAPKHDPSADTRVAGAAATVVDARPQALAGTTPELGPAARTERTPPTPRTAGAHGLDQSVESIPGERSSLPVIAIVSGITIALTIAVTVGLRRERVDEAGTLDLGSTVAASPSAPPLASAPPSAPTPASASAVAPHVSPAVVQITVQSRPPGAEIFQGEAPLGTAGLAFPLPRGSASVTLLVRAPGHTAGELTLVPDRARELEITLKKPGGSASPPSTPPTSTASPTPPTSTVAPTPTPATTTAPPATTPRGWDLPPDLEPPR